VETLDQIIGLPDKKFRKRNEQHSKKEKDDFWWKIQNLNW